MSFTHRARDYQTARPTSTTLAIAQKNPSDSPIFFVRVPILLSNNVRITQYSQDAMTTSRHHPITNGYHLTQCLAMAKSNFATTTADSVKTYAHITLGRPQYTSEHIASAAVSKPLSPNFKLLNMRYTLALAGLAAITAALPVKPSPQGADFYSYSPYSGYGLYSSTVQAAASKGNFTLEYSHTIR
jgi:hypothetical protein